MSGFVSHSDRDQFTSGTILLVARALLETLREKPDERKDEVSVRHDQWAQCSTGTTHET